MTAPSNTPDKPMTREEAINLLVMLAAQEYLSGLNSLGRTGDRIVTASETLIGEVFDAGESFARQSILKEMEEAFGGTDWYCPKCQSLVDARTVTYDEYHEPCGFPIGAYDQGVQAVLAKLKGEGV